MSANTWSDPLSDYGQHHPRWCDARFLDPRHLSSSNTSPCGNQPANISLTVNIDNDTFDTTNHNDQQKRRPGTIIPDAASPCPLDKNDYISVVRVDDVVDRLPIFIRRFGGQLSNSSDQGRRLSVDLLD